MIIKLLFFKPVIDFGRGRIGFGQMLVSMAVRWIGIMLFCLTIIAAYIALAPGVMTGKFGAPNTEAAEREARNAAFQASGESNRQRLMRKAREE